MASQFALIPGMILLAIPLCTDLFVPSFELVLGGNIAYGTVQTRVVVSGHLPGDDATGIIRGQRSARPDTLALERLMPPLTLLVALGIAGGSPDVGHGDHPDEFVKIFGDKLRAVVGDDSGSRIGDLFLRPLKNDLHICVICGLEHGQACD